MSAHAGGQPRGRSITAKHLCSADSVGPAQTEMIPFRVEAHETVHEAVEEKCGAETCEHSFRGAVVVQCTCGCDILATVVMRRHQEAHSAHSSTGSGEPRWPEWASWCRRITTVARMS